jgi:hypothetical protein
MGWLFSVDRLATCQRQRDEQGGSPLVPKVDRLAEPEAGAIDVRPAAEPRSVDAVVPRLELSILDANGVLEIVGLDRAKLGTHGVSSG